MLPKLFNLLIRLFAVCVFVRSLTLWCISLKTSAKVYFASGGFKGGQHISKQASGLMKSHWQTCCLTNEDMLLYSHRLIHIIVPVALYPIVPGCTVY